MVINHEITRSILGRARVLSGRVTEFGLVVESLNIIQLTKSIINVGDET